MPRSRHAADRDQSEMGARGNAGGRAQPAARRARRTPRLRRASEIADEDVAINRSIGRARAEE